MTVQDLAARVGQTALLNVLGLTVPVEVLDGRRNYGRTDYLVRPTTGTGSAKWFSESTLTFKDGQR